MFLRLLAYCFYISALFVLFSGWHQCTICQKNAYYMCYTCTFSLCKGCIKDDVILCVRGSKGFCKICMRTVKLIEGLGKEDNDVCSSTIPCYPLELLTGYKLFTTEVVAQPMDVHILTLFNVQFKY